MSLHKANKPYFWCDIYCFQFHSIFLHMRKVRRMAGFRDAKIRVVKVEWVLNWTTFFVTRLGCHVLITYKLISDAPKFGRGIELPLALFGMAGMNLLNIILGRDLYRAYKREKNRQRHQEWRFCPCDNCFKHCVGVEMCAYWVILFLHLAQYDSFASLFSHIQTKSFFVCTVILYMEKNHL